MIKENLFRHIFYNIIFSFETVKRFKHRIKNIIGGTVFVKIHHSSFQTGFLNSLNLVANIPIRRIVTTNLDNVQHVTSLQ